VAVHFVVVDDENLSVLLVGHDRWVLGS
jgi:hypothetical protein